MNWLRIIQACVMLIGAFMCLIEDDWENCVILSGIAFLIGERVRFDRQ